MDKELKARLEERSVAVLQPLARRSERCHEASLEIVRAGVADRVARGWCRGIGRHSWAVVGPLDYGGWSILANYCPVEGWPAGEIYAAMDDTPALKSLVPIDRLGMLTNRNPGRLYLREEEKEKS